MAGGKQKQKIYIYSARVHYSEMRHIFPCATYCGNDQLLGSDMNGVDKWVVNNANEPWTMCNI